MNLDDLDDEWGTRMALRKLDARSLLSLLDDVRDLSKQKLSNAGVTRMLKQNHYINSELHRRIEVAKAKALGLPYSNEF